ncbi:immune inhibitor A domain-containing protein, partial [Gemmatimonadota bacterium]
MRTIRPDRLLLTVTGLFCLLHPLPGEAQTITLIPVERAAGQLPVLQVRPQFDLPTRSLTVQRTGLYRQESLSAPALPDTFRVLVLRLEFQIDDDPRTTGDGSFDLRGLETFRAEEGHDIDAAPHDRGFVERHVRALHNYWWAMSKGALNITSDVYPSGNEDSYRLPREMAHYGFETTLEGITEALEALAADAVRVADAGTEAIDWSGYDAFILFHAGADWQGDTVGAGNTPADLPTAWVRLGEPVRAGSRDIFDMTILPESVSQDGIIGAINGVFVHEFGHQLGLPDLYDTVGFETAVGLFALMDSGGDTGGTVDDLFVWGILPAALSAWERLWFGWSDPVEVGPGESIDVVASTALAGVHDPPAGPDAALIRAGEKQSFLVEFRSDDLDGDPSVSLFWEEGVIDGTGALIDGEKVRTFEYDALLPSSGVLIWHLDDAVAEADPDGNGLSNFEENTLQNDRLLLTVTGLFC